MKREGPVANDDPARSGRTIHQSRIDQTDSSISRGPRSIRGNLFGRVHGGFGFKAQGRDNLASQLKWWTLGERWDPIAAKTKGFQPEDMRLDLLEFLPDGAGNLPGFYFVTPHDCDPLHVEWIMKPGRFTAEIVFL